MSTCHYYIYDDRKKEELKKKHLIDNSAIAFHSICLCYIGINYDIQDLYEC
jgi:hypothetical protein